jgi:hypothetical protein
VQRAAEQYGLKLENEESESNIIWMDSSVSLPKLVTLSPWQRINHFPGMHHICHKDYFARNLSKMRSMFLKEYAFWPKTWCMNLNTHDFFMYIRKLKKLGKPKWFIAKPDSKSRGVGIYLFSQPNEFIQNSEWDMVVQEYIERVGRKQDLVLRITGVDSAC